MKKLTILAMILICLLFHITVATPISAATVLKEGVYKPSDINYSSDIMYTVQNASPNISVYFALFDENQVVLQALKLDPNSPAFNIPPLRPNYRLAIIGDGDVTISEKTP